MREINYPSQQFGKEAPDSRRANLTKPCQRFGQALDFRQRLPVDVSGGEFNQPVTTAPQFSYGMGGRGAIQIVWWNATTKSLHGMECQNRLPYTCDVKGAQNDITMNWDGKEFVIDEMETSKSGKKSVWHEVWSEITPNSFTQTGEYGDPGSPRKRLFTIHATRLPRNQIRSDLPKSKGDEPAPEMQSLAKALKGNWSTTYELAPGGIYQTGGSGRGEGH